MSYALLRPELLGKVFEKVEKYLPDFLRDPNLFAALYASSRAVFFEVGVFGGVFWLSDIILGRKAVIHVVLWDGDCKDHYLKKHINAKRVVQDIFRLFGLQRLEARIPIRRVKACEFAEAVGFSLEGVLRKAEVYNGETTDLALYSLLREEI